MKGVKQTMNKYEAPEFEVTVVKTENTTTGTYMTSGENKDL